MLWRCKDFHQLSETWCERVATHVVFASTLVSCDYQSGSVNFRMQMAGVEGIVPRRSSSGNIRRQTIAQNDKEIAGMSSGGVISNSVAAEGAVN